MVLFADTFSTYFEPQVLRDGLALRIVRTRVTVLHQAIPAKDFAADAHFFLQVTD